MTHSLPDVNDLITLRVSGDDSSYPVRVRTVEEGSLVVTAPIETGDAFAALDDALLVLEWSSVRGLRTAPVHWLGNDNDNGSLWRLQICGAITASQRRRYVRAALSLPGLIHVGAAQRAGVPDLNTATALTGTLLDLSEAAMRFVLPQGGRHADALATGRRVTVEVNLMGETMLLPGEVLNALPIVPPGGGTLCVVVVLDDPGPHGTVLRKAVFQAQINARKAWA